MARVAPPQSQAPRPTWPRSALSVRCQFVQCKGVHTSTKRAVLLGSRTACREAPSPWSWCWPGSQVACATPEVAKGSDLMCTDTVSTSGTAPIQFSLSDAALVDPSSGFGEWAVKWKLPQGQFIRPRLARE